MVPTRWLPVVPALCGRQQLPAGEGAAGPPGRARWRLRKKGMGWIWVVRVGAVAARAGHWARNIVPRHPPRPRPGVSPPLRGPARASPERAGRRKRGGGSEPGGSEPGKSGAEEAGGLGRRATAQSASPRAGSSPGARAIPSGAGRALDGAGPGRGGPWTGRALPLPGAPRALPGPLRSVLDAAEEALLHHRHHQLAALVEQLSAGQAAGAHRDWGLLLVQQPVVRAERAVEPHRVVQ